jgi:hypothetical protein
VLLRDKLASKEEASELISSLLPKVGDHVAASVMPISSAQAIWPLTLVKVSFIFFGNSTSRVWRPAKRATAR